MFVSVGCLDFLPPLTIVHCVASHSENTQVFTTAVPVKQSAKVDSDCIVLCLCWTMRRPGGLVSSLARGRAWYLLYQSKAYVCLRHFWKMIFFLVGMSVSLFFFSMLNV